MKIPLNEVLDYFDKLNEAKIQLNEVLEYFDKLN
jgi:Asp-tRNA(Asn)/Glu-tRNA(Gln) amidotransferase C subunit